MSGRRGLQTILTQQLLLLAGLVTLGNIVFVALFDASDSRALFVDVMRRELLRLEARYLEAGEQPDLLAAAANGIYDAHPEAYGFALVTTDGTVLASRNAELIAPEMLAQGALATDWMAWPNGGGAMPVVASHIVQGTGEPVSLVFALAADPANLIGAQIFDEFLGHVWLPLLPIAVVLIGGSLLIIRRALRPVAEAAAWARSIRPGGGLPPLEQSDAPAEIVDLTDAVRRGIERLDAELRAEQRRAAEAAHALRTPVAVLVARLDDLPPDAAFDTLRQDIRTLSRMVTQFLSSSGADRLEIGEDERVDLGAVAETVVAELVPLAEACGAELSLANVAGPLPAIGSADAVGLALTNLIENAVHHGGPGQVRVSVGPRVEITVTDDGPGLPEGTGDDLFEPFQRGSGAHRGGAGLGLAIVARIQRAHGGGVTARTLPEGGAEFRLSYRPA